MFTTVAHNKGIKLDCDLSSHTEVWADLNSLSTILRNLVNNALKFTKPGGEVSIKAEETENEVIIEIRDTGIGMSAERMRTLFKFKEEEKRTWGTNGEKGIGLGLRLAYEFAQLNGGSLKVRSKERIGTSFFLNLPKSHPKAVAKENVEINEEKEILV